jgi:putative transposase
MVSPPPLLIYNFVKYKICQMSANFSRSTERKRNRKKGFNYSNDGAYFITSCVQNQIHYFGEIKNKKMILNKYGKIVLDKWRWLLKQYAYVSLGEFIVMPNHVHGIIYINSFVGTSCNLSLQKTKSLSELIGAFKTVSSKGINKNNTFSDFRWQRSFHDRIIRNEKELKNISEYIYLNPKNWKKDKFNLIHTT